MVTMSPSLIEVSPLLRSRRGVRRLYADRKDHKQLEEVLGKEEFDVIFDISAYVLKDVQSMVDIFEGQAGHYIFDSSIVVHAAANVLPITEDSPWSTARSSPNMVSTSSPARTTLIKSIGSVISQSRWLVSPWSLVRII